MADGNELLQRGELYISHCWPQKNAANCLFNTLKTEYRKQNLFTFQELVESLNRSDTMMVSIQQLWRTFLNMTNY